MILAFLSSTDNSLGHYVEEWGREQPRFSFMNPSDIQHFSCQSFRVGTESTVLFAFVIKTLGAFTPFLDLK